MRHSSKRPFLHGRWPALAGLGALVLVVWANAFGGVWQLDDFNVIVDLATVHSASAWWDDLGQGIRPLLKLSYLLNWLSDSGEAGFHAVNLLIHLACSWLVLRLSEEFLKAHGLLQQHPTAPWLAAALFALHPAQTEAVTYICGRSVALMALFYLLGVLAHVAPSARAGGWRKQLLPALYFALALGVKETAVTFALALLLWDLACGKRLREALRSSLASWLMLLLATLIFVSNPGYESTMQRSLASNTLAGNAASQTWGLLYLLRQWALPLWLNIDPDLPLQPGPWHQLANGLGLALLLSAAGYYWRSRRWIAFAVGWVLLHLLLLYVFVPRLDVANDRQLYLAIWPPGLALVLELQRRFSAPTAARTIVLLLAGSAVLTVLRNQDYRSEVALWEQTVRLSPDKSRVHNNLGYALGLADRPAEARREFLAALQLDTDNVKARLNLRRLNAERAAARQPP